MVYLLYQLLYSIPGNSHDNGKPPIWRCISYQKWWCSIIMLVFGGDNLFVYQSIRVHSLRVSIWNQPTNRKSPEPQKKTSYFPLNPGWLIGILISWVYEKNPYIYNLSRKFHPQQIPCPQPGSVSFVHWPHLTWATVKKLIVPYFPFGVCHNPLKQP